MMNSRCRVTPALLTTAFFAAGVAVPVAWAGNHEAEIPFSVAKVLIQLNDTDEDLGFHARIDGEPWKMLEIEGPDEQLLLKIRNVGPLRRQGLTELNFESAEPTFDELSPEEFFDRFPEGEYEISGVTTEGDEMESTSVFTHVIPAAPLLLEPLSGDCEEPDELPADMPVIIAWDPVTASHPDLGVAADIAVAFYELTIEREEPEPVLVLDITLPPETTEFEVPEAFIALGEVFKYQVLVGEAGGNETSSETCFAIAD